EIREDIEGSVEINKENIMVTATHTHAGPDGIFKEPIFASISTPNEHLISDIKVKIKQSILNAVRKRKTAEVRVGKIIVEGASANRRVKNGPVDKQLISMRFDDNTGKMISAIINFACHPTVLDASNLLISADYPGYALSLIEKVKSGSVTLFLNGAAGDVSTRYVRCESSFREAERIGNIVGSYALISLETSNKIDVSEIEMDRKYVDVRVRRFPLDEEINQMISRAEAMYNALIKSKASSADLRRAAVVYETLKNIKKYIDRLRPLEGKTIKIEVQVLAFGDKVAIVGIPGEMFTEMGMKIKENSPFEITIISGYTNGYIGYIPTPEAYESLSYESTVTIIEKDSCRKIYETAVNLLEKFKS
ncbi:MAG: hypothetical protein DRJ60_07715, partial [Thermoprotei archaeon]